MKKLIPILLLAAGLGVLGACETQQTTVRVSESINLPKHIKVVAQSCDATGLYQTVIDLANNEVVILIYNKYSLISVIRTGILADPDKQALLPSRDAPGNGDALTRAPGNGEGRGETRF